MSQNENTQQTYQQNQTQSKNNNEANPKLLSLLDKMVNPVDKLNLEMFVDGVHSFPEEWMQTDQNNPGAMFTYQVKFLGLNVNEGKIHQREQTEKELKEIEDQALAKKKGKKDAKKGDEPQMSPEEEEALRLQQEQEEEEERKFQEEWNALSEEEKFHRTQEDKYKSPQLYFEMDHTVKPDADENAEKKEEDENAEEKPADEEEPTEQLAPNQAKKFIQGGDMANLDECIYDEGGAFIYFCKFPNMNEEELAKLKKGKPKTLNLNDLNEIKFRAWVDLSSFQVPGTKSLEQRCKIEQIIAPEDEENQEIPRPELDNTYIKIRLNMDPPCTTLIEEIQPKIQDIIPEAPPLPKQPAFKECINEFKAEVQLAMESLALEYSNMFSKELNNNQEQKGKNIVTLQKKQEIQKRKEQFIYDFNTTGKYKVLKERLKKSIVKICRDKFQKHGSITGITTDQKDQFYSELYVFLMEQTRQTLSDLIEQKKEELHEDIVTSYDQTQKERDRVLQHLTKESPQQRLSRKAAEYEMLNDMNLANKNFAELIASDDRNPASNFDYCQFLLRKRQFDKAEELLTRALSFDSQNCDYQFLMACLLMRRGRPRESSVFLKDLTEKHPSVIIYNAAYSFLYGKFLGEQKLADKYKRITERVSLRRLGELQAKKSQKTTPNPFDIPNFKADATRDPNANKGPQLKPKQWDETVYYELIQYFARNGLFDLVEKSWDMLYDPTTIEVQIIQCQMYEFNGDYDKSLEIIQNLLEANPQNVDVVMMKANICYISDKLYESEDIFLKALKLKEFSKQSDKPEKIQRLLSVFLRLGNIYLKRKSWGDAKAIFVRACELKITSSLSWLGLGVASLRMGQMKEAEEALTQANIYDPFSGDVWGYLALLCLLDNGRFSQANQALRELFKIEEACDLNLLEELGDQLTMHKQFGTAENLYNKILELAGPTKEELSNYGTLCMKLGKTFQYLKKYNQSIETYQEAKMYLEGEKERDQVDELIDQAKFLQNNPDYQAV